MLIAKCADTSGNIHTLSKIISMTLNRDEFIPADDLKLVVPLDGLEQRHFGFLAFHCS